MDQNLLHQIIPVCLNLIGTKLRAGHLDVSVSLRLCLRAARASTR
jgi:hypothetical protein